MALIRKHISKTHSPINLSFFSSTSDFALKYGVTKLERYHFASAWKLGRENFSLASDRVTERDDRCVEIYAIDSNGAEWRYKEALLVLVSPLLWEYISLRSAGVRRISINLHVEYLRIFSRAIGAEDSLSHLSSRVTWALLLLLGRLHCLISFWQDPEAVTLHEIREAAETNEPFAYRRSQYQKQIYYTSICNNTPLEKNRKFENICSNSKFSIPIKTRSILKYVGFLNKR